MNRPEKVFRKLQKKITIKKGGQQHDRPVNRVQDQRKGNAISKDSFWYGEDGKTTKFVKNV
jgi:hypothetical protein